MLPHNDKPRQPPLLRAWPAEKPSDQPRLAVTTLVAARSGSHLNLNHVFRCRLGRHVKVKRALPALLGVGVTCMNVLDVALDVGHSQLLCAARSRDSKPQASDVKSRRIPD